MAAHSMHRVPAPAARAGLLLIEHDSHAAQAIARPVTDAGYAVDVVKTAASAFDPGAAFHPSCIIFHLPSGTDPALQAIIELRAHSDAPLLVISEISAEDTKVGAFALGADDYLSRPFGMRELVARVGALLRRGQPPPASGILGAGDLELHRLARRVYRGGTEIHLTRKEFQILLCLAQKPDVVISAESILAQAWGSGFVHYGQALRVHIGHLRRKLRAVPPPKDLIRTVAGVGYALVAD